MTAITGFHLMMPPGWSRYRVDEEGRKQFMAKLGARMKELGHPELDVRLRMLAGTQWRRLEETRTHSVYLPDSEIEGTVSLPMSIALRQHVAPVGVRFGDALRDLTSARIDVHDTAIGPVQRWQSDRAGEGETEGSPTARSDTASPCRTQTTAAASSSRHPSHTPTARMRRS